ETLWTTVDDLNADAQHRFDFDPVGPFEPEREPRALVRQLANRELPWLIAEIERARQTGDAGEPAGSGAGGEVGEGQVDADHDAEFLFIDVVFDGDEGDRFGILEEVEIPDDQETGVSLALGEEDEDVEVQR